MKVLLWIPKAIHVGGDETPPHPGVARSNIDTVTAVVFHSLYIK